MFRTRPSHLAAPPNSDIAVAAKPLIHTHTHAHAPCTLARTHTCIGTSLWKWDACTHSLSRYRGIIRMWRFPVWSLALCLSVLEQDTEWLPETRREESSSLDLYTLTSPRVAARQGCTSLWIAMAYTCTIRLIVCNNDTLDYSPYWWRLLGRCCWQTCLCGSLSAWLQRSKKGNQI